MKQRNVPTRPTFSFGEGLVITFVPDHEEYNLTLLNNNMHDDFLLEIHHFTGCLKIQRIKEEKIQDIDDNDEAETADSERSGPFSMALGHSHDLVAALALEEPQHARKNTSPTPEEENKVSSVQKIPQHLSDEDDLHNFANQQSQVNSQSQPGSPPLTAQTSHVCRESNDEILDSDDPRKAALALELFKKTNYAELESDKPIDERKKGQDMFKHLAKKVMHHPDYHIKASEHNDILHPAVQKMQGGWGKLLYITSVKKQVPLRMRERRHRQQQSAVSDDHLHQSSKPPSTLHELCADPNVTLSDLQKALEAAPEAVAMPDGQGRLPLHILGDNDALLGQPAGKQAATSFAWTLMQHYPEGLTVLDQDKYMPFCKLIDEWMQYTYETYRKQRQSVKNETNNKFLDQFGLGHNVVTRALIHNTSTAWSPSATTTPTQKSNSTSRSFGNYHNEPPSQATTLNGDTIASDEDARAALIEYSVKAHPPVELWDEVEWSLTMLSLAMDELGGKNGGLHKAKSRALVHHHVKDRNARTAIVTHLLVTMPTLLKTILLLEDDNDGRKRLLKLSLVRRILLIPQSVGPWLTNMLRRKGIPSTRAVDYLEMVSTTTVEDFLGTYRTPLTGDIRAFHEERQEVFSRVEELDGTIASLVTLDRKEIERAATTLVVWSVMSGNLRRPFVVGLVLIDFVLHITLMLAFRNNVMYQKGGNSAVGNVPVQVVIFICAHYFLRKVCESLSLWTLSRKVFRSYFSNIWTLFDFVAIILTLVAVIWNQSHMNQYRQGFNTFVLGLLWIKVLGFLKVVNKEMSTFILALIQILRDLKYFAVVLMVIIFMFGDMMHIAVSTKDEGLYCIMGERDGTLSPPAQDFCSAYVLTSYLRVYALLLGDFQFADWKKTRGLTVLVVVFTMIGTIILLNVLIAVISDSYEKAKIESVLLFGRARVTFVAQNEALESFLRPGASVEVGLKLMRAPKHAFLVAARVFRYMVLLAIIATAMDAEVYLVTRAWTLFHSGRIQFLALVTIACLSFVLTMALWVVLHFIVEGLIRNHTTGCCIRFHNYFDRCSQYFVNITASKLFGLADNQGRLGEYDAEAVTVKEEWTGRLNYMEKSFERNLNETKEEITKEIQAMEKRLYEHQAMMAKEECLDVPNKRMSGSLQSFTSGSLGP